MNAQELALAVCALSTPGATFILGAGASAPAVPTFAQLARAIASHVSRLGSFPGLPIPRSGLRDLMQPVLDQAKRSSDLTEWKAAAMTTATIAAILEAIIARAHRLALPQYKVFSLFSLESSVVSFNWDGLAASRCSQRVVLHPHGIVEPQVLTDKELDDLLFETQLLDEAAARHWYLPNLVLPGEETDPALSEMRAEILQLWMDAPAAIVIGYSFGLTSNVAYDQVWLDSFVEAFSRNGDAPIHLFSPDAPILREALCDRLRRDINVFAWALRWDVLASALLDASTRHGVRPQAFCGSYQQAHSLLHVIDQLSERAG